MKSRSTLTKVISLVLCFLLVFSSLVFADTTNDYTGHWAEESIKALFEKGFVTGYTDGTFKPDAQIQRAEFMAIINRAFGFNDKADISFTDVKEGEWHYEHVARAVAAGYIKGFTDGTMRPTDNISRQEAAVIIARILGIEESADTKVIASLKDGDKIQVWSAKGISAIISKGYISLSKDGSFEPAKPITRAEMAVAVEKSYVKQIKKTYAKAGIFTAGNIDGSVRIDNKDITLMNTVINGDLILGEGIGDGDVHLLNVVVKGETLVKGGGENSIVLQNCQFSKIIIIKEDNKIRILAVGNTKIDEVDVQSGAKLESENLTGEGFGYVTIAEGIEGDALVELIGNFESVEIRAEGVQVQASGGTIGNLEVANTATNVGIALASDSRVTTFATNAPTTVTGTGQIETAQVNVSGTKIEVPVAKVEVPSGVKVEAPKQTPAPASSTLPTSGGGGGGNSGGGGGRDDDPAPTPTKIKLATPTNFAFDLANIIVSWDKVPNSSGYILKIYNGQSLAGYYKFEDIKENGNYTVTSYFANGNISGARTVVTYNSLYKNGKVEYGIHGLVHRFAMSTGEYTFAVEAIGKGDYINSNETVHTTKVNIAVATTDDGLKEALTKNIGVLVLEGKEFNYKDNGQYIDLELPINIELIVGRYKDDNGYDYDKEVSMFSRSFTTSKDIPWFRMVFVSAVNNDALEAAIAIAEDKANNAKVGYEPGNYPQEAVDALEAAISIAQEIAENDEATQEEVDEALSTLSEAVETFEEAVIKAPDTYRVTVYSHPVYGGTVTVAGAVYGENLFKVGDEVTVKAEPKEGYKFTNWTGDIEESDENPYIFTMPEENVSITANFELLPVNIESIEINEANQELKIGHTLQLTTKIEPGNATNKNISWSTSDESIATVDNEGLITAVAEGSATITVSTEDGGKTDSVTITVVAEPIDKSALEAATYTINGKMASEYTAASWKAFETAKASALALPETTQEEVNAKVAAINAAIAKLVENDKVAAIVSNVNLDVTQAYGLALNFKINEEINFDERADVKISYFTKTDDVLTPISNTKEGDTPLVKDKTWGGYLWSGTEESPVKYSKGSDSPSLSNQIPADTTLHTLVKSGFVSDGSMDYTSITDWTQPATYVVKIEVTDNDGNISIVETKEFTVEG